MKNNTLPTVLELSTALKNRIDAHKGGFSTVWKEIDERFKDLDKKSISGKKYKKKQKISYAAFKKAYQRLDAKEEKASLERMTFGIKGNPLLLNNVFEILGIKSFSDLLGENIEFKKPDVLDEIINIDASLDNINKKIDDLTFKLENANRASIRMRKVSFDFEDILYRLYSIFEDSHDASFDDPLYVQRIFFNIKNTQEGKIFESKKNKDINSLYKNTKLLEKMIKSLQMINQYIIISSIDQHQEVKRICLFFFVLFDYKYYIYKNKMLLEYYKHVEYIDKITSDNYNQRMEFVISPLFMLYFLIHVALLHINNLGSELLIIDDKTIRYIRRINENIDIKQYIYRAIRDIGKKLSTIISYFIKYNIENIPQEKYNEYNAFAKEAVNNIYNIFLAGKELDTSKISKELMRNKTIKTLFKMKNEYFHGVYHISLEQLELLDILYNKISDICQAIGRDLDV